MLTKKYVRDGQNRIIGSVTTDMKARSKHSYVTNTNTSSAERVSDLARLVTSTAD
jgi:hypothetical protein